MNIHVCTYVDIYTDTRTHTHIYIYTQTHTHIYILSFTDGRFRSITIRQYG